MKTRTWLLIFGAILLLCAVLTVLLYAPKNETTAEIFLDGEPIKTVDLRIDQTFEVESPQGRNTVAVEDGAIRVTEATCPDHVCIDRGACSGGAPIVCLPNRLVIRFGGSSGTDATAG